MARLEPGLIVLLGRVVDRLAGLGRIKLATIVALATANLCAVVQPERSIGTALTQAVLAGLACYLPLLLCAVAGVLWRLLAGTDVAGRNGAGR